MQVISENLNIFVPKLFQLKNASIYEFDKTTRIRFYIPVSLPA
ncbi:MAG: hypothetical protein RL662_1301 [Bacteroidota bacterium]|jgi:hypothetical protein